ncbi:GIY-YIG nuclease family protein [Winogradskyella maritima]|uniref:GIY-YIG nuclease family protein n=1 Tax=Winogradskyella maritima TaxID=1517766 RepID=A0ABV8AIM5_9FLAO|nr:GIY-YIG nuclease family protein [Winogradskyella maritima]
MHFLYIIYSKKLDKYYVGETVDLEERVLQHNTKHYKSSFTSSTSDWILKLSFQTINRTDALFLETFIKRMKSRKFIEKIIDNSTILSDLLKNRG